MLGTVAVLWFLCGHSLCQFYLHTLPRTAELSIIAWFSQEWVMGLPAMQLLEYPCGS